MCLCSHKTHRELLLRLVNETNMILLAIDYRRPPEHPWPIPVDDCYNVYKLLMRGCIPSSPLSSQKTGNEAVSLESCYKLMFVKFTHYQTKRRTIV